MGRTNSKPNITAKKCWTVLVLLATLTTGASAKNLEKDFVVPPDEAKPWVYWFWLNGNISKQGITADLEAMKRVGIGGALIMEVDQGIPAGPIEFMSKEWRELFKHAVSEARRLGLQVNMNNDAGWNGSGGPWIKPEQSMQKVVWTELQVEGPRHFEGTLAQPEAVAGYYRDIAVLAFPTTDSYQIPDIVTKAAFAIGATGPPSQASVPSNAVVQEDKIIDLSRSMTEGKLTWSVPPGKWTIVRFGHTSTGMQNSPAPASGRGLECDKLSKEGAEANFKGMIAKLVADNMQQKGNSPYGLVATHVDSWENGSQNWTLRMREEFKRLRGYDPIRFLPVLTGRVVGNLEVSERFLRDLRQTISDLVVTNYARHIRELAHQAGLRFTVEAYGSPCDNIPYAGQADEPMGEFWTPHGAMETCKAMASAAHVYGKRIVGAEAFTADAHERWLEHPALLKPIGDLAFCQGINRFVIHRYAHQPWVPERRPGMTMGPWGQHYERTQTWWEQSRDWHTYLSRCQHMLRQGLFAADICYLQSEIPFQTFRGIEQNGYGWDECSPDVVINRMSVANGRIVLPDGMNYKLLVLPDSRFMTPEFLEKIKELVEKGATVVGPPPLKSPSLTNYPACDDEVRRIASELWGEQAVAGTTAPSRESPLVRHVGKGRVIWGIPPEKVLEEMGIGPDFYSTPRLHHTHRTLPGTDIYFVANPKPMSVCAKCMFRIKGRIPEFWWPDSGKVEEAPIYTEADGNTWVNIPLGPHGSVFVVFRKSSLNCDVVTDVLHNGKIVLSALPVPSSKITVNRAHYGILNDSARCRDVTTKVKALVDAGETCFQVSKMAEGDDPAYGQIKTLVIDYTIDGKDFTAQAADTEYIELSPDSSKELPCEVSKINGKLVLTALKPGTFAVRHKSGDTDYAAVPFVPPPIEVTGPWKVVFNPNQGATWQSTLERLSSLSEHPDPAVRYFSGTATYHASFSIPRGLLEENRASFLDLGDVQVMAEVILNGRNLGLLWKPPFRLDICGALKSGVNELEIKVINLWPNRLIGDEELPEDSDRNPDGTLKSWPAWLLDGKASPTGRQTFTTWRLWKKGERLPESGLLGPVTIHFAYRTVVD